jgi:hypothetical protein
LASPGPDQRLVSLTDLYATILDAVDSPMPHPVTSYSLLAPPQREMAIAQCVYPEMWQKYLTPKQARAESHGKNFSPPIFAVVTAAGWKIIEKRDGSLEAYDLRENMIESEDLSSTLPPATVMNYRVLLETLKTETGFHEATAAMLAPTDHQTAGPGD